MYAGWARAYDPAIRRDLNLLLGLCSGITSRYQNRDCGFFIVVT